MKKTILILIATIGFMFITNAQTYRLFKIDLGIGQAAMPNNSGVLISTEPTFAINDNVSIGLKLEQTFGSMKWINSELLTGNHYFANNYSFRPFAGGGIGYYYVA
jgi:hypothetical protein